MPLLSVIIPVYNVAPYLTDLVGSLACFRDEAAEIIFVDDASTDGGGALLAALLAKSGLPDVVTITQPVNRGLSAARNTGLARAGGEYVWFIDSDDIVNGAAVPRLLAVLREQRPDVALFDYFTAAWGTVGSAGPEGSIVIQEGFSLRVRKPRSLPPKRLLRASDKFGHSVIVDRRMYVWTYCFRREQLPVDPFPEGRNFEDISTTPGLVAAARTAYYLPQPLIVYRRREGSITKTPTAKNTIDLARAMTITWRQLESRPDEFTAAERKAVLYLWLNLLSSSALTLHRNRYLLSEDIRQEFIDAGRAYKQAAGPVGFPIVAQWPSRKTGRSAYVIALMLAALPLAATPALLNGWRRVRPLLRGKRRAAAE